MEGKSSFAAGIFTGKRVLITGGGTGIGFGIAHLLGSLGAEVILIARTKETLNKAMDELRKENITANYFVANIRDENEVKKLFEFISSEYDSCDFLINNAGGQFAASSLKISSKGFRAVVDLNLQGTWHMCSGFAHMLIDKKKQGRIVNVVLCLKSGMPGMVHAAAARAGVVNMTKTLAYEWGQYGLTVNAIAPGTIDTKALGDYDPEHLQNTVSELPIPRVGTVEEVAEAATYLLSPAGSYVTGTTLEVDGGEHLLGARNQV